MNLRYIENPDLDATTVAVLRSMVGWDTPEKKPEKTISCNYMTAACYDEDQLVGFVDVLSDSVDDALIRSLVVHPDYRRQGIGLELLRIVIKKIKADRIKTINVLFEPELTAFYGKAGFRIVSGGLIDNKTERF